MDRFLRQLIDEFRFTQDRALDYLHGCMRIPVPTSHVAWAISAREHIEAVSETVDRDGVALRKHGFGIEVIHPNFRIDYDYGPAGEPDCFDSWRLALFRHRTLRRPGPVQGQSAIEVRLREAHIAGQLETISEYDSTYIDPHRRSCWRPES